MHYSDALSTIHWLRNFPFPRSVGFVSPVLSAVLAASKINGDDLERLQFRGDAAGYAASNGLADAIADRYSFPKRKGLQGVTYTKLTKLATHPEVDACNAIVNDLIDEQISPVSVMLAGQLRKIVGELHDNVASHARGAGFSSAQVYTDSERRRIEFAIADAGCGMLANVHRVEPGITDHREAIRWCLQRFNTTARKHDEWAQRVPDDPFGSPFGEDALTSEDHHMGEGLWKLSELIRSVDGKLCIVTGDGQFLYQSGKEQASQCRINWNGVIIEFELTATPGQALTAQQQDRLERLAERLGL